MNRKDTDLLKSLEGLVKTCVKLSKERLDQENAPVEIPIGFYKVSAEKLGLKKVIDDVPIPWFKAVSPNDSRADIFDTIFWMSMREGKGDPEEVWRLFIDYAFYFKKGIQPLLTGMKIQKGMDKGRSARWPDTGQRLNCVQTSFDEQRRKCPNRSNNLLIRHAAEKCHVSQTFIREHLREGDLTIPPAP